MEINPWPSPLHPWPFQHKTTGVIYQLSTIILYCLKVLKAVVLQLLIQNCFQSVWHFAGDLWPSRSPKKLWSFTHHVQPSCKIWRSWMQLILSYWSETIFKLQAPVSWTSDPVCPPKIEVIYSPCPVTCKVLRSLRSYSQVIDLKLNSKCRPMTLNFDPVSPKTIQFIYKRCPTFLSTKYQVIFCVLADELEEN